MVPQPDEPTISELRERARRQALSAAEIDAVVNAIRAASCDDDVADLLLVLGEGWVFHHEELIARFLNCRSNQIAVRTAFAILCDEWNKTGQYLDVVRTFMRRSAWDDDHYVQIPAISTAGEFVRAHPADARADELVAELWAIAHGVRQDNPILTGAAIEALARALGDEYRDLLPNRSDDPDSPWARDVFRRVRDRYPNLM